ncbi:MAG TPA: PIN domain-containing protein [Anaeromyxobacteraceae bacterium]|nr:PIN domain-containing protein [Anaeromyxobacteraceae bacterium]
MARPVVADTDVLIDYQVGEGAAGTVRRLVTAGRLRIPAIAYYELLRGATDQASRETIRRLLHGAPMLALTRQDVESAAGLWRQLTPHQRDMLGDRDILIAGAALARGWPLLTRNRQHFAATAVQLHAEG